MDIIIDLTAFHEDPHLRADHWTLVREYLRKRDCLLIEVGGGEYFVELASARAKQLNARLVGSEGPPNS
jgi:hypothetical protein